MEHIPSGKQVVTNTTFLTSAYVAQKLFAFVYFTIIARWVGDVNVGKYVFAISLTTILSVFIDLGLTPILIREISKFKDKLGEYLNTILSAKLLLAVAAYGAALAAAYFFGKDEITRQMVYLAGLVMIFDSLAGALWGVFRAQHNLKYESVAIVINQILILSVGIGGLMLALPLWVLVAGLLTGSVFSFLFAGSLIALKLNHRFRFILDLPLLKTLFILAAPFALAGIFTRVYSYIDQIMLSVLIGDRELGWYSVAYKITFALQFIPSAFAASMYPAMSNYFQHAHEKLAHLFEKTMNLLMLLSVPIAAGTIVIAQPLIIAVYTNEFSNSVLPLQILIAAMPAIFLSFPVGSMLNACNKQYINTINLGVTMVINIILNILLIPHFQHVGASIAAVVSLYYLFFANVYFVDSITLYNKRLLITQALKIIIASAAMALMVWLALAWGLLAALLVGVISYPLCVALVRAVRRADIVEFLSLVKRS